MLDCQRFRPLQEKHWVETIGGKALVEKTTLRRNLMLGSVSLDTWVAPKLEHHLQASIFGSTSFYNIPSPFGFTIWFRTCSFDIDVPPFSLEKRTQTCWRKHPPPSPGGLRQIFPTICSCLNVCFLEIPPAASSPICFGSTHRFCQGFV